MSGIEFAFGAAVGAAIGAGVATNVEEFSQYVIGRRSKWAPANRPCNHPLECDVYEALGITKDETCTSKLVASRARKASRWWHPDNDKDGVDHGFTDFQEIRDILVVPRLRKLYRERVSLEMEVMQRCGEEMRWRPFNTRFIIEFQGKSRTWANPPSAPSADANNAQATEMAEVCHVFLDATGSMSGSTRVTRPGTDTSTRLGKGVASNPISCLMQLTDTSKSSTAEPEGEPKGSQSLTRIEKAKAVFRSLFPRFEETPTCIHLIGAKEGPNRSRLLVSHGEALDQEQELKLLEQWSAAAGETYLWHYIFEQTKDFKDANHEIIIITDGTDHASPDRFSGLLGFNELMGQLNGGRVRISLYLIGTSLSSSDAKAYQSLCLATGGFFHDDANSDEADALALQDFVVPLLLPEGVRDRLAHHQQTTYQKMLQNGEAQRFSWYLPLTNGESSGASENGNRLPFNPAPRVSASTTSLPTLLPSARVKILGLQGSPELNGKFGTCKMWLVEKGRWEVKLDEYEQTKALKANNLQALTGSGGVNGQHVLHEL